MMFKLDENLDVRLGEVLTHEGYDVATVPAQNLSGSPDTNIYQICRQEGRTLITMDLDFSNPLRSP
jgi:predicted nuclease of predicted toxin-antitoxin system